MRFNPHLGLITIIFLLVITGCPNNDSSGGNRKPINLKAAPDFTAITIDGKRVSLSKYKGKKVVIVDIWATWCGPCKTEMPLLQELYAKHSDKLEIIAASQDPPDDISKIRQFVRENNLKFKIIHDVSQEIARKYPSRSIPFLTIIDKNGEIVKSFTGFHPSVIAEIETLIQAEE